MSDDVGEEAIATIRRRAQSGFTTGRDRHPAERAYLRRCTHFHWRTGTLIMFTKDIGHHSSGWMKNPEFERCRHLSISFRSPMPTASPQALGDPETIKRLGGFLPIAPYQPKLAAVWVKLLHGDDHRLSWEEGPFSREGRLLEVRPWRVFVDPGWNAIQPRGEVYSKELTPRGWKSWSEVQGDDAAPNWVDAS